MSQLLRERKYPGSNRRTLQPLPLKLADVSLLRVKNNANQIALSFIFLVIFHLPDLLKWLPVGHLEFKKKGSAIDLQRQVNSAHVARVLGDDAHHHTGKIGIEYTGVKALVPRDIVVGVIIVRDACKKAFDLSLIHI